MPVTEKAEPLDVVTRPSDDNISYNTQKSQKIVNSQWGSLSLIRKISPISYLLVITTVSFFVVMLGIALPSLRSGVTNIATNSLTDKTRVLSECIDKYSPQLKRPEPYGGEIGAAFSICYSIIASSLLAEEQENRNGSYVLQKSENIVLMWMVVVITVSGVVLAGLQLLASYELAKTGKGELATGGSVGLKPSSVVVQSSVIGVVILAISFAFFMVFVVDVYRVEDIKGSPTAPSQAAATSNNVGQSFGQLKAPPKGPVSPEKNE